MSWQQGKNVSNVTAAAGMKRAAEALAGRRPAEGADPAQREAEHGKGGLKGGDTRVESEKIEF